MRPDRKAAPPRMAIAKRRTIGRVFAQGRRRARIAARRLRREALLYAAISAGGVIGSLLRWQASLAFSGWRGFPWGTLFVNITGSFAIGFIAAMAGPDGRLFLGTRIRQFAMTGVCGGYTTFSAFSLETVDFLRRGAGGAAALYVGVSILSWIGAVWLGEAAALRLNRMKGA